MTQPKCYSYIRFSTPEQARGDSKRRQIAYAKEWAKENKLPLDDKLNFQDLGISAFSGANRTRGALGKFLQLVEEGKIAKGSVLIIEAMDRLSREQVMDALSQFIGIIKAGIKVVTLADGYEYDAEAINRNPFSLNYSIMQMSTAYEESAKKSVRLKEAWVGKRDIIGKYKLTARAPKWLRAKRLPSKRNGQKGAIEKFEPIKERAAVIQKIFNMKLDSIGSERIATKLNQTDRIWKPKNGWHKSYVNKILRTRAVIGEFQPHKTVKVEKVDGSLKKQRVPEGAPIKGYFPTVVSEEIFYQVQNLIKGNRWLGGKNGVLGNLFSCLAVCGYCGSPMRFLDKGKPPKGQKYYVCDYAKRGLGCQKKNIRYDEIERLILTFCKGLDPDDILQKDNNKLETSHLQDQLASIIGKIESLQAEESNLIRRIAGTKYDAVAEVIEEELSNVLTNIKYERKKRAKIEAEIEQLLQMEQDTEKQLKSMTELMDLMDSLDGQERIELRIKLRGAIRKLIDYILIFPFGQHRWTEAELEEHGEEMVDDLLHQGWEEAKINQYIDKVVDSIDNMAYRSYLIKFRSGAVRVIKPRLDDKLAMDIERVEGHKGIPVYFDMSNT